MAEYHPTHKAKTFKKARGGRGNTRTDCSHLPKLYSLQQPSDQLDKLQTVLQTSPTRISQTFVVLGANQSNFRMECTKWNKLKNVKVLLKICKQNIILYNVTLILKCLVYHVTFLTGAGGVLLALPSSHSWSSFCRNACHSSWRIVFFVLWSSSCLVAELAEIGKEIHKC